MPRKKSEDGEKTPKVRGIQKESSGDVNPYSSEASGRESVGTGSKSIRIDRTDGKGVSGDWRSILGKILSQLRKLQKAHLAYVKAHEDRLEARLQENRSHQEQITEEMSDLEREVLLLLESTADEES